MLECDNEIKTNVIESILASFSAALDEQGKSIFEEPVPAQGHSVSGLRLLEDGSFVLGVSGRNDESCGFVSDETIKLCFQDRFREHLTSAELKLIKTLLCGGSLRQASIVDGRAYETKRNQMAVLRLKVQVGSQAELVQILAILLTREAHSALKKQVSPVDLLQRLLKKNCKSGARLHRFSTSSQRDLLVVDLGPIEGRPQCFMHSSIGPFVSLFDSCGALYRSNTRFLIPIRSGYFGQSAIHEDSDVEAQRFAEDWISFTQATGLRQVPMVAMTTGANAAISLAQELDDLCPSLTLCSPPYLADVAFNQIRINLRKLATLIGSIASVGASHPTSSLHLWQLLRKIYATSPDDLRNISTLVDNQWAKEVADTLLCCNVEAVVSDLAALENDWIPQFSELTCETRVFYGETDPFSNLSYTAPRLRAAGVEVNVVPGFGQSTNTSRPELLFNYLDGWAV